MAGAPIAARAAIGLAKPAPAAHPLIRRVLILLAVAFLSMFILVPLVNVFVQAFSKGLGGYIAVFSPPKPPEGATLTLLQQRKLAEATVQAARTWHAIGLTLSVACIVVPLNIVFGLAAAWATTKFRFRGRALLISLIDLPFSVSPVVAGLVFVLLLGRNGILGSWAPYLVWPDLFSLHWVGFEDSLWPFGFGQEFTGVIFTPLAIVLASVFVTFPFVARSLTPLMEAQGTDEELAALSLGASRLAHLLQDHPAQCEMGDALWRDPLHGPRLRRVRRGVGGVRPCRCQRHHALAHRKALERIQQSGGLHRRLGARAARGVHARRQEFCRLEDCA